MDIVDFLRARIDEDEARAKTGALIYTVDRKTLEMLKVEPEYNARVLREVEAKRRIVDLLDDFAEVRDDYPWTTGEILHHLASVYSDHPSFREEWKP